MKNLVEGSSADGRALVVRQSCAVASTRGAGEKSHPCPHPVKAVEEWARTAGYGDAVATGERIVVLSSPDLGPIVASTSGVAGDAQRRPTEPAATKPRTSDQTGAP